MTPLDNAYNRGLIEWNAQWLDTLSFAKCPDLGLCKFLRVH